MVVSSPISTDPSPIGSPDNSVHHSHSRLLSAILVTLNVALILLIYVLFWRFFWRKKRPSDQSNHNGSLNSTTSSPSNSPRARRTDGNVIASLPVFVHELTADTDRVECSVCLSEVKIGERCRVLPRCSHKFHVECVDMWFQFHSTCPLCRAAIDSKAAAPPPPPDPDSGVVATNGDELV